MRATLLLTLVAVCLLAACTQPSAPTATPSPALTPMSPPTPTATPTAPLVPIMTYTTTDESGQKRTLPVYAENAVIGGILADSELFRSFYQAAMADIDAPVYWVHDPSLETPAKTTIADRGERMLVLREVPAREPALVAHELEHFVLDAEGFPRVRATEPRFNSLAGALNSSVHNPLVDSRLQASGFDLSATYQAEAKDCIQTMSRYAEPPEGFYWVWVLNYVGVVLLWEDVQGGTAGGFYDAKLYMEEHFPEVAVQGKEVLGLVRTVQYETPEEERLLFGDVIETYGLGAFVELE